MIVISLTVADRAWMVFTTMDHASDDLTVIWLGATDYARGIFHEPFFYGQDYGVMLEALLAAPFIRLGVDPVIMIAMTIGLLAIAPYLAFALYFRSRDKFWAALIFAAMPLLLPVEHGLQITALNGIALLALVPLVLNLRHPAIRGSLLAFILLLGVLVNPNAALLALPIGLQYLIEHHRQKQTWFSMASGVLPIIGLCGLIRWFFADHIEKVVKNTLFDWRMHFKPYMVWDAVEKLDLHFAWTGPLAGDNASIGLLMLLVGSVMLFIQRHPATAWAGFATIGLIILAFCFVKVHEGANSIFFPLSRAFIGMPLVLAWIWSHVDLHLRLERTMIGALCIAAIFHGGYRMAQASTVFANALQDQQGLPTQTCSVHMIKKRSAIVADLASRHKVEKIFLLRGDDPFSAQFLAYAIPVFYPDAPTTWMVAHDRRIFQHIAPESEPIDEALIVASSMEDLEQVLALNEQGSIINDSAPYCAVLALEGRSISEVLQPMR
ncbi:MAG: hypothetical protein M3R08_00545 [Bacteroidota bacterium]|nr:hypothetical protein [Bacteroidota bacterium]